ncbi:trypsin-like serine peptidase [Streptomyces sp. NPDC004267]|uniref:trypsin-like serine peptidase n=1 Tax=Streptomyces sp. NPDC004267 TaxID=3364694 RepID=UPI003688E0C7
MRYELKHRPLTPEELRDRAPEIEREGREPPAQLTSFVTGAETPRPKVAVHRTGDGWLVDVEVNGAKVAHRAGRSEETIPRPSHRRGPLQLDGFVPAHAAVRLTPETAMPAPRKRLIGKKGEFTPLGVFPPDGRTLLTDKSYPWRCTGLVTTSDGEAGSGVLVGDRLVLTAHHLRPSVSIGNGSWWVSFAPEYDNGNGAFGASDVSDLRHYDAESDDDYRVGHDYMLCRLFEPIGVHCGYLGSTVFADSWRGQQVWANVGYPKDVGGGQRPAVQWGQSMEDDYEDDNGQIIETEASLNHGNSGGPFFSTFDDGNTRLCGVVSGEGSFDGDVDNALASGEDMVALIDGGRADWPA